MKNFHAALFEPHSDLSTNPSLVEIISSMSSSGWDIDIFMPPQSEFPFLSNPHIRQFPFPARPIVDLGRFSQTVSAWIKYLTSLPGRSKRAPLDYNLALGVDSKGIIAAQDYFSGTDVPLIYLSFELLFAGEVKTRKYIRIKRKEKEACREVDLAIVQDKQRANLLSLENQIEKSKVAFLPVAPANGPIKRSNFLRDYFDIPTEKTIVLHAGSLADWTCSDQLFESAFFWPEDFVLVIHTRNRPSRFDAAIRGLMKNRPSNIFLSLEPLSIEDYHQLVASADIGLSLYRTTDNSPFTQQNLEFIGLSSGKFSYYMRHGIPAVTTNQEVYKNLLKQYNFGHVISDFKELPSALLKIREEMLTYKNDAKRLFDEQLDFNIYWPEVFSRIESILKVPPFKNQGSIS